MDMPLTATIFIAGVVKPLLVLLLLFMVTVFIRNKSASLQHFVLIFGLIGVLLQPLISFIAPNIAWHVLPSGDEIKRVETVWLTQLYALIAIELNKIEVMVIVGVYSLVASWLVFYFLLGVMGLYKQTRAAAAVCDTELTQLLHDLCAILDIQRTVKVVTSKEIASPQMWGFIHPVIMLPRAAILWDYDKKLAVMMHELGHVRRCDWLLTLIVKITCAIFWFLPPVWWFAQKIYQQAEIACDDFIYQLRNKHIPYAESLLAFAGGDKYHQDDSSLKMRGYSALYERINAVLDNKRSHQSVPVEAMQYWVLFGGLILVLMASVQLLPLKNVFFPSSHLPLHIKSQADQVDENNNSDGHTVQIFDWSQLKNIRQGIAEQPPALEEIESLIVRVPRPSDIDLDAEHHLKESVMLHKPDIKIQGYLPLEMVTPEYPVQALQRGIEGWVQVSFTIGINGEVLDPKIIAQHPSRIFSKSVLKAIKHSRYRPQFFDGQPVVMQGVVEQFTFKLQPQSPPDRRR